MSNITSNASCDPSSISVSGKTSGSGTISWSLPTVPAGGVINSCKLTGTCTVSDTSGKPATVTVNGTSVSSDVAFTINLGTGNTTSSVAVAATGPHKNTNSTITFSNLIYTVDYETNVTYTVTFKDWDGTVLNTQTVKEGSSATAPTNPTRDGHRFIGWDIDFSSITSDLTVTAQYKEIIEKEMCIYSFDSSIDTLPVFNDGYEYRYTDVTNSDGTITRTILSDIEPTAINFKGCTGLKTLDYMDLTNLIEFEGMFNKCTSLTTVKLENCPANANTVNDFQSMFAGCTSLTHAYISGINFENAQYMNYMFSSCSSLEYVDFGNFNSIHELEFASTFYYGTTRNFTTVVVDNPPANSMNKLIGLLPARASTLPSGTIMHNATDTSEWDIETLNSRNWQLSNNNLSIYTVTFKDWDGTVLKTETIEEGASATAPDDPTRDGYVFTGWDIDFSNVTSNLTVTAQYEEESEEPDLIEPVDGYIAKNLVSYGDWSYTFNVDWDTQYLDIEVLNYGCGLFGTNYYYDISNNSYDADYSHESVDNFTIHGVEVESNENDINIIRYSKVDGVCIITSNGTQIIPGNSFVNDNKMTIKAVIPTEWLKSEDGVMTFNIKITDIAPSEEPDNNELIQGDINDETGTFEDEVSNVVKTNYIDVSNKKQILVNVLTEDVYILKCYLYNANKELVKVIDISADKKRMFGLDLQKLIEEVMNNGNE